MTRSAHMVSIAEKAEGRVRTLVSFADYTSYRLGGPAHVWVDAQREEGVGVMLREAADWDDPVLILGGGCNMLVSDNGWPGIVLHMGEEFAEITVEGNEIKAQAGARLMDLVTTAVTHGLGGMEQMAGIPGTVGGALRMNAGAFGQEIEAAVTQVEGFKYNGDPFSLTRNEIEFGYRSAPELEDKVITTARFVFEQEDPEVLTGRMEHVLDVRGKKQPLEYPSCGSVFKRPRGYFAGALIEESGLKGMRVGGAVVSEKHAGFILNTGNATSADVRELIRIVEEKVYETFGVQLEREVKLIGFADAV